MDVPLEYTPPPAVQSQGDIGEGQIGGIFDRRWANFFDTSSGCSVRGVAASCHDGMSAINNLGVMRPNLIQVTINITYQNHSRRTIQFVTTSAVIGSGFNHTFRGGAAVAAASAWNQGLSDGAANALLDSISAGFEAEAGEARRFAHAPQNTRRHMTAEEISDFRGQLQTILKGDCKKFMDGVMANIPGAHNVMDVFNYMANHGELFFEPGMTDSSGRTIRGYGGGNVVDGSAMLVLNTGTGLISVALHELIHASGGAGSQSVSHYAMAQAAVSALASAKIDLSKYWQGPGVKAGFEPWEENVKGADVHNGQVFQNILINVCRQP